MSKLRSNKTILILLIVTWLIGYFIRKAELFSPLSGVSFSKVYFDTHGQLLRMTVSTDEKYRVYKELNQISPQFIEAIQLSEDKWFSFHPGINPISLMRAAISLGTDRKIGASTITMQLVRIKRKLYTKNIVGKIQQIIFALGYEFVYSKNQILEAYINLLPFGGNIEGVESASRIYFKKDSRQLDLAESLLLAVIPQNPIKRNLNNFEKEQVYSAKKRLVSQWFEKYPADQKWNLEIQLPMLSNNLKSLPNSALHFTTTLSQKEPFQNEFMTTLDLELQIHMELIFKNYLKSKSNYGIHNGSVLLVDNLTSSVKAWVGSGDFFSDAIFGQIDGNTTPRSPGSTLKPFLYGLAIDEGIIHPETMLKDTQSYFGGYDPENFDLKYKGPISATEALIQSRNIPAVYLNTQLKGRNLYHFLNEVGQYLPFDEKHYGLAISLGAAEVTPVKLSEMYSLLAHQGIYRKLNFLSSEVQLQKTNKNEKRLLSPESSFLVLKMLTDNPRTESYILNRNLKNKNHIAWKTGTSWGFRDAWTAGVVGPYTLIVWLGNFDYSSNPQLIGREIAAPLFFQLIDALPGDELEKKPDWLNTFGLNLKKTKVCSLSGAFSNGDCTQLKETYFISGVSPITKCAIHRQLLISNKSGLRICNPKGASFHKEVFEFWPSDILEVFNKMNLQRRIPPAFERGCSSLTDHFDSLGSPPTIVLPKTNVNYTISFSRSGATDQFPLKAIVDAGVKQFTWFANSQLLGQTRADQTFLATLGPGKYNIMVVDDQGRFAEKEMNIVLER